MACCKITERCLKNISGVNEAKVELDSGKATVVAEREINLIEIEKALEGTGFNIIK